MVSPPGNGLVSPPRRARSGDIAQITAIEKESYPTPWPEEFFRRCLAAGYDFWVIAAGDCVEAYAVMAVLGGVGHLMNLCVRVSARRRGVGRRLLDHLLGLLRDRQCGLFLEVRESNLPAQKLYRSAGLQVLGRRRGYYEGEPTPEDAVVMALPWCELQD